MSFKRSIIPLHIQYSYIYTWRNSPCFSLPLLVPFYSPFVSPSTYLAPSSCDRNRPPPSQVACKLTPFAPPFTQPSHPSQIPNPNLSGAKQRRPREYSGSCYPEQEDLYGFYHFSFAVFEHSQKMLMNAYMKRLGTMRIIPNAESAITKEFLKVASSHIKGSKSY